jgi:hypothetical protein
MAEGGEAKPTSYDYAKAHNKKNGFKPPLPVRQPERKPMADGGFIDGGHNEDEDKDPRDMVGRIMAQMQREYAAGGDVGKGGPREEVSQDKWGQTKAEKGRSYAGDALRQGHTKMAKFLHKHALKHIKEDPTGYFSEGGMIANSSEANRDTDYLADNDELEFEYTGANSGDELSSPGEDERRKDIVSRIMASRKKKDKLPNPR